MTTCKSWDTEQNIIDFDWLCDKWTRAQPLSDLDTVHCADMHICVYMRMLSAGSWSQNFISKTGLFVFQQPENLLSAREAGSRVALTFILTCVRDLELGLAGGRNNHRWYFLPIKTDIVTGHVLGFYYAYVLAFCKCERKWKHLQTWKKGLESYLAHLQILGYRVPVNLRCFLDQLPGLLFPVIGH